MPFKINKSIFYIFKRFINELSAIFLHTVFIILTIVVDWQFQRQYESALRWVFSPYIK